MTPTSSSGVFYFPLYLSNMKIIKLSESQLTNIIKQVLKENETKDSLIDMIKEDGWKESSGMVGGSDNLKKLSGIDTPMKYLSLFNDLNSMTDELRPTWKMFFYHENKPTMMLISNKEENKVYMNIGFMDQFLRAFNLDLNESREYIKDWLLNSYDYDVDTSNIIMRRGYPFNNFRSESMT